jgi:hypothetical protein
VNIMFDYAKATFKRWQVKTMGQRPTDEMLTTAAHFAKGKPGKFALCLAMALRPEGVTAAEMVNAVGDPKHNVRRELIKQKLITYLDGEGNVLGPDGHYTNAAGHRVYHVGLTAKGTAFIDRQVARAAKAATVAADAGKANGHSTTGKGKKPTSEAPRVTEGPTAVPEAHTAAQA